jgi:tartrate dehydrogenase/decarboxylase/D-malate dehydrogenase
VVGSNLFGDILSDLGPLPAPAPSASRRRQHQSEGNFPSVFEPVPRLGALTSAGRASPTRSHDLVGRDDAGSISARSSAASIVGAIERTLGERTLRHAGSRRQGGHDRVRQGVAGHGG